MQCVYINGKMQKYIISVYSIPHLLKYITCILVQTEVVTPIAALVYVV